MQISRKVLGKWQMAILRKGAKRQRSKWGDVNGEKQEAIGK